MKNLILFCIIFLIAGCMPSAIGQKSLDLESLPVPEDVERQFEKFDYTVTTEEAKRIVENAPTHRDTTRMGGPETRGQTVDTLLGIRVDLPEDVQGEGLMISVECAMGDDCNGAPLPALTIQNVKTGDVAFVGSDGGLYIREGDNDTFQGLKIYTSKGTK